MRVGCITSTTAALAGEPVFADPEEAVWLVVHRYDEKGDLVEEVWVDLRRKQ